MTIAMVGNIVRDAIHDGPGIRTTVFFKGCALNCTWCHNPELISSDVEIAFRPGLCIGCGDCVTVCPEDAVSLERADRIDRSHCTRCGECARVCPAGAVEMIGLNYNIPELMEILLRDRIYYECSNGGVTLSGGEPTLWIDFIKGLLRSLKAEGIHTTIQTNGFFSWSDFAGILPFLDLVHFDIKVADPKEHLRLTGASNEPIFANLRRLLRERPNDIIVRIPLIPGYTATENNVGALANLLREIAVLRCSLLPYHPYGLQKLEMIGKEVNASLPQVRMSREEVQRWRRFFDWADLVTY